MELGIVIPLKAKSVSRNWHVTCENLERTIRSIQNQSSNSYRAVIVGHDCPEFLQQLCCAAGTKFEFVEFDNFRPPVPGESEPENQINYEADRCSKILRGIIHLDYHCSSITHWFALDADDLLHKDFIKILSERGKCDAYILDRGYFYFKNSNILNKEDEFSAYCGSSAIIAKEFINLPNEVTRTSFRQIPFGGVSHVHMKSHLIRNGLDVSVPEERLIIYVRDHGENISNAAYCARFPQKVKKYIKSRLRSEFLSPSLRDDFSLL